METIIIENDNYKIFLHSIKDKYFGFRFNNNNSIEQVDNYVFNFFNFIKLSSNKIKLAKYFDYEVYLDKDTNYKHYFKDGEENYELFFDNNGEDALCYANEYRNRSTTKMFRYRRNRITIRKKRFLNIVKIILAVGILATGSKIVKLNIDKNKIPDNITIEQLRTSIEESSNISEEDKEYLFNEELLEQILPIVNTSTSAKYSYLLKFSDLNITSYLDELHPEYAGFYSNCNPNIINISNSTDKNTDILASQKINDYVTLKKTYQRRKDVLSHEFVHLCQIDYRYHLLVEACAEIISNEFYSETGYKSYSDEVKLTKKLMEIIGPEPIWYYNFSGDISMIKNAVSPYLSEEELSLFEFCLDTSSANAIDLEVFYFKIGKLNNLLNKIYYNKYKRDVSTNPIINALDNNKVIERYYFNPEYTSDVTKSYYYDDELTMEEAFDLGILLISYTKNDSKHLQSFKSYEDYLLHKDSLDYEITFDLPYGGTLKNEHIICPYAGLIRRIPPIAEMDFSNSDYTKR